MAKKEKISIQRDKRMEPIDNELDAAMGLLDNANKQISDLLASFAPEEANPQAEEARPPAAELEDGAAAPETAAEGGAPVDAPKEEAEPAAETESA